MRRCWQRTRCGAARVCVVSLAGVLSGAALAQGATPTSACLALSSTSTQCTSALLGNGWCDDACNFAECDQDNKDCECKITADCNTGQSCSAVQGLCYKDSTWSQCSETRCNADAECSAARSSCDHGHRCRSGSCAYSCDAWCEDTYGAGWISDGSRTQDGRGNKCVGCVLKESAHVGWIIFGCLVGGVVVSAAIGVLLTVLQKSQAGKAQPVVPVGSGSSDVEVGAAGQTTTTVVEAISIGHQPDLSDDSDSDSDDEAGGLSNSQLENIPDRESSTHPTSNNAESFERSAPQFAA